MGSTWISNVTGGFELGCQGCDGRQFINVPIEFRKFNALLKRFEKRHSDCVQSQPARCLDQPTWRTTYPTLDAQEQLGGPSGGIKT